MKHIMYLFGCILLLNLSACYTIHRSIDSYRSPAFQSDKSFMVISALTDDKVSTLIEQTMLTQGFKVIADNHLRSSAPAGTVVTTTGDTTYNTMQYQPLSIEMFKAKKSDYIIRYTYTWRTVMAVRGNTNSFDTFNASVINTETGAVEFTYSFREKNRGNDIKDLHFVISDLVNKIKGIQK